MNARSPRSLFPLALLAAVLPAVIAAAAGAAVPSYGAPQLLCRANFSGAYNLPNSAFFTNSTPSLNDAGHAAIHLSVLGDDTRGVFYHDGTDGIVAFEGPTGAFLSDVTINDGGRAVFPMHQSLTQDGIWRWDLADSTSGRLTNLPLGASTWGNPKIDDSGRIGYRAGFSGGQAFASWDNGNVAIHATENGIDSGSSYAFLFTPSTNQNRQIAAKVRLGTAGQTAENRPDQIRIWSSNGTSTLVAEDFDSNLNSPYARFDNSVSLTERRLGRLHRARRRQPPRRLPLERRHHPADRDRRQHHGHRNRVFRAGRQQRRPGGFPWPQQRRSADDFRRRRHQPGRGDQGARPGAHRPRPGAARPARQQPDFRRLADHRPGRRHRLRRRPHPAGRQPGGVGERLFVMRAGGPIFADGFESASTAAWSQTVP